jgi:heat shock protein HspQ
MGDVTYIFSSKLAIGQLVHHLRFDYRGVIVDVDPTFQSTEAWYETVALSRPPRDKPWYHVLVDDALHATYVAERNLEPDPRSTPISHPMLSHFFSGLENGRYIRREPNH